MGTFVEVKAIAPGREREGIEKYIDDALTLARKLEKVTSIFNADSELNKLNLAGKLEVSPELFNLLRDAVEVSRLTGGEFDVTVTPIVKADGFYGDMPKEILDEIPDTFEGVGWENIELSGDGKTVTLLNGAWIDLSAIAKGYIVDRMSKFLKERGIEFFLINAGGEIYCAEKPKGELWRIGVRKPATEEIVITLGIENMAVATSGDYENVVRDDLTGEVVSHIIDPRTQRAVKENLSSVTVIADKCYKADALATGMMAMGTKEAIELSEKLEGVETIIVNEAETRSKVSFSRGAEALIILR